MVKENALSQKEYSLTLEGEGDSKKEAVGKIFNRLRKDIYKEVDQLIVQMEPKNVHILEMETTEYTEKFLFFFMPKKKEKVRVKAVVVVDVKYIEF